ncbi:unnamed protein product [Rhizoctonia solani]|uniref:BAG domain-containing protein n=1 Tax=Rhizoctonia solani TaxID=456999 RepID=A0A8H3B0I0_9AGAM|nr:unnamed protein product [Rhizoctonia solani]
MPTVQYRQIPVQPGHTGDRKSADTVFGSSTYTLTYNEFGYAQQPKDVPGYPHIPSSPPDYSESTKSSPRTELARSSSRASSSSGSNSSGKSVSWGQNDSNKKGHTSPEHYSADSPKCPSKPILKYHETGAAKSPSLFAENAPIIAASLAMDDNLKLLVSRVRNFKRPSELEFSLDGGSHIILPNVEKNKSFIDQLRKLQKLAYQLDKIPTHGDAKLEDKRDKVSKSIEAALSRMGEFKIKLYVNFLGSAYDDLVIHIQICIKGFVYPCELDFPENSEGDLVISNTKKNKPFVDQLHTLGSFLARLGNIPEYDNEQLKGKREAVSEVIERNLDMMKKHQLSLYYRWAVKSYRPHCT